MSTAPRTWARRDPRGESVTTYSAEAVERLEQAIFGLLGHRADTGRALEAALALDPGLVPALCLQGFAYKCLGRRDLEAAAESCLARAQEALAARGGGDRERALVAALASWCAAEPLLAARQLSASLVAHPRDLLTFKLQQALHFILGRPHDMRAGAERALAALAQSEPGYGHVLGCRAFALEETGQLAQAERDGRRAIELEPLDAWGAHAVAHVLERQDRSLEGLAFMQGVEPQLAGCNNFRGHLAWHRGLFLLQLALHDEALALYDHEIAIHLGRDYRDVSNSSSLLFQLERAGVDVGDRWQRLAQLARERIGDHRSAFADAHYMLALVQSGEHAAAAQFLAAQRLRASEPGHAAIVQRQAGVPLAAGIAALGRGGSAQAVRLLAEAARGWAAVGGSHAQRDTFWHLLLTAAERSADRRLARALLGRRLAERPANRFARERLAALCGPVRERTLATGSVQLGA